MSTAAQCQALAKEYQALAKEYKDLAQESDISADRAALLNNIGRSFKGLATQLDMLAANTRDERPRPGLGSEHRSRPSPLMRSH